MRITHKAPSIPVRRNTTRTQHRDLHARSQPNMRQLESVSNLDGTKSYKSMDRDTPTGGNMTRLTVSQSAPHTPVSAFHSDINLFKSVPRLLSDPIVSSRTTRSSPGIKSLQLIRSERCSPYFNDKKIDNATDSNCDLDNSNKSLRNSNTPMVPVHSPKIIDKRESRFTLKSPILKKDTKIQLDNVNNKYDNNKIKCIKTDGTDV